MTKEQAIEIAKRSLKKQGKINIPKDKLEEYIEKIYYWCKEKENEEEEVFATVEQAEKYISERYKKEIKKIEEDIYVFYGKYSEDGKIEIADTRKLLTKDETKRYNKENGTRNKRVTRQQSIKSDVSQLINRLDEYIQKESKNVLETITQMTRSNNEKEFKVSKKKDNKKDDEGTINKKYEDKNYKERIDDNMNKLKNNIMKEINRAFTSGKEAKELVESIKKISNSSFNGIKKILRTEGSRCYNETSIKCYKEYGNNSKYQIVAVRDSITCSTCRMYDLEIYDEKYGITGVNIPPFHGHCRCITIPYIEI